MTGSTPMTAPMLMTAWLVIQQVAATASKRAEAVRAPASAARSPYHASAPNSPSTMQRAQQPALLADHREDEVGVGVGEQSPLLPSSAQARGRRGGPSPAPRATAPPGTPIPWRGRRDRGTTSSRARRYGSARPTMRPITAVHPERLQHGAQGHAAGVEQGEGDEGQHQGRAHVGLLQHEQARHRQQAEQRDHHGDRVRSRRSARRARRSAAKTAMASFMSSDGWMRSRPDTDPPARAARDHPDAGHEHRHAGARA